MKLTGSIAIDTPTVHENRRVSDYAGNGNFIEIQRKKKGTYEFEDWNGLVKMNNVNAILEKYASVRVNCSVMHWPCVVLL